MKRVAWKNQHPTSLRNAMELCIKHALAKHNRSVETIADLMGMANHWTLYKWMESGKMPAVQIRSFEHACGIDFVTRYLATSSHKLLIDIPAGKPRNKDDLLELQTSFNAAMNSLVGFYNGSTDIDETMATLTAAMSDIAGHRENVKKVASPELELFGEEGEDGNG